MKNEYIDHLKPGGPWNLEMFLNEENQLHLLFYLKQKDDALLDQKIDVSQLAMSSHVLYDFTEGQIRLNVVPKLKAAQPEAIELTADNFGLNHMCFNRSAVIYNETYYLGDYTGFGERLKTGVPGLNNVELSLKPLKDWQPIGTYYKGTIHVGLEGDHLLKILRVGIGPSGFENGGPFIVYGKITPAKKTQEKASEDAIERLKRTHGKPPWNQYLDQLIQTKQESPYATTSAGTIGSNYRPPIHLLNAIGTPTSGHKCGSLR
ncbi:hypothetical protein [Marinicella meishanensis]|uniref:hypothetical protein n=1 Tax=Marinicella meishanensis TaxID=2873263 RepID=UPI001CBF3210|nr:hypothetical protein [Marinicella sp. NBU2979]